MKFLSIFNKIFIPFVTIVTPLFLLTIIIYVDSSIKNNPFFTSSNKNQDAGKILFMCFYIIGKIQSLKSPVIAGSIIFGIIALIAFISAIVLWSGYKSKGAQVTSLVFGLIITLILIGFSVFMYLYNPSKNSIKTDFSGNTWVILKNMTFKSGYSGWLMYTIAGLSGFGFILMIMQIIFVSKFNTWQYMMIERMNQSINLNYENNPSNAKLLKLKNKISKINMNANKISHQKQSFDRVAKQKIDNQYKKKGKYVRTLTKQEALAEKRNLKLRKQEIKNQRKNTFENPLKHKASHTKVNSMKNQKTKQEIDFEKQRNRENIILDKKIVDKTKTKANKEKSLSAKSIGDADKIFNITSKTRQQFQSNLKNKDNQNKTNNKKNNKWNKKKSESIYSLDK